MKDEPKKLYRSRKDKMIAGVCGGIAEHFNIDPVWIRLVFVLLLFADGIGLLIYLVLWILVPKNPSHKDKKATAAEEVVERVTSRFDKKKHDANTATILIGAILVFLGLAFLMQTLFRWFSFNYVWPIIIILIGVYILGGKNENR